MQPINGKRITLALLLAAATAFTLVSFTAMPLSLWLLLPAGVCWLAYINTLMEG